MALSNEVEFNKHPNSSCYKQNASKQISKHDRLATVPCVVRLAGFNCIRRSDHHDKKQRADHGSQHPLTLLLVSSYLQSSSLQLEEIN